MLAYLHGKLDWRRASQLESAGKVNNEGNQSLGNEIPATASYRVRVWL